jgi:predicted DNA-binding ribbon-helix-helix protein
MSCSIDPFKAYKFGSQLLDHSTLKVMEEMAENSDMEISDAFDELKAENSSDSNLPTNSD